MPRDGLGGRFSRGARIARTGARGAFGLAGGQVRRMAGDEDAAALSHRELAAQLAEVLGDMKGAAMKLGQLVSIIDLDLPEELRATYQDALAQLRDSAPAMDAEAIEEVVQRELGAPAQSVFAEWSSTPLAAASIGQVHAATLHDGRRVAVKVQYPGVADAVRADLANAESFAPIARVIAPNLDVRDLMDEVRERIEDELDYRAEARYQTAFVRRYTDHPFIVIPRVVDELTTERVLVMDLIEGRRFDDVASSDDNDLRQRVGEIIFRYNIGSVSRFRLFNGDPHPGNYLVTDEGNVAFLDYGSVKMLTTNRLDEIRSLEAAIERGDRDAFATGLRTSGFLPHGVDVDLERLWEIFSLYSVPTQEDDAWEFTSEYSAKLTSAMTFPDTADLIMMRKLNLPADYMLLMRIQWGVTSMLARLRAQGRWRAIRDEYVNGAAPATALGEADQQWYRTTTT